MMDKNFLKKERKAVADFMVRLYHRGLTTISGGNISLLHDTYVLMTTSGLDKGKLKAKHIVILTREGENLTPELTPTMEKDLHLANHGVLSTEASLLEAFDRIELLEIPAKTSLIYEFLKQKISISEEDLKKIAALKP